MADIFDYLVHGTKSYQRRKKMQKQAVKSNELKLLAQQIEMAGGLDSTPGIRMRNEWMQKNAPELWKQLGPELAKTTTQIGAEAKRSAGTEDERFGVLPGYWQHIPEKKWPEAADKLAFGGKEGTKPRPLSSYRQLQDALMWEADPEATEALERIKPNVTQRVLDAYETPSASRGVFGGVQSPVEPEMPSALDLQGMPTPEMRQQSQIAEPSRPEGMPEGAKWNPVTKEWTWVEKGRIKRYKWQPQ